MVDFTDLDLTGVDPAGPALLSPGRHRVRIAQAKFEDDQPGRKRFTVRFKAVDGSGEITKRFAYQHTNDQARRISQQQLKALAIAVGHPNPNRPFHATLDWWCARECEIVVGYGKPYMKDGVQRQSVEVKAIEGASDSNAQAAAGSGAPF